MTLDQFITTKPAELRLGQYFYNTYLSNLKPEDSTQHSVLDLLWLYNTPSDHHAKIAIQYIMEDYQWEELPDA